MLQLPGTMWEFLQSTPARKPARRSEPNGSVWEPRCFQQNEVSTTVYAALVRYFCYFWPACIVQCADIQYDMCSVQVTNLTSRALRTLLSWPGNWIRSLACPLVDGKPEPGKCDFVDAMFGPFHNCMEILRHDVAWPDCCYWLLQADEFPNGCSKSKWNWKLKLWPSDSIELEALRCPKYFKLYFSTTEKTWETDLEFLACLIGSCISIRVQPTLDTRRRW